MPAGPCACCYAGPELSCFSPGHEIASSARHGGTATRRERRRIASRGNAAVPQPLGCVGSVLKVYLAGEVQHEFASSASLRERMAVAKRYLQVLGAKKLPEELTRALIPHANAPPLRRFRGGLQLDRILEQHAELSKVAPVLVEGAAESAVGMGEHEAQERSHRHPGAGAVLVDLEQYSTIDAEHQKPELRPQAQSHPIPSRKPHDVGIAPAPAGYRETGVRGTVVGTRPCPGVLHRATLVAWHRKRRRA